MNTKTIKVPTAVASSNMLTPEIEGTLQHLIWADLDKRRAVQKSGLNITPVHFYSNQPSIEEIENSYEYVEGEVPYLNSDIFDSELLHKWLIDLTSHSKDFSPPVNGNEETCEKGFFWENSQFSYSDAMSYYAFLRRVQPNRVVEIGSGFSTLIAIEALKDNGVGSVTCIEPFPRSFLLGRSDIKLEQRRAQELTADYLNDTLADGDVLFIDSTHTVKAGSDCLHIYLRLLPHIKRDIFIHVHDIFLPFAMPKKWQLDLHIYWTEQYLLMAWLLDNPKTSILFGSSYHAHFNKDALASFMHGRFQEGGSSLWISYQGSKQISSYTTPVNRNISSD